MRGAWPGCLGRPPALLCLLPLFAFAGIRNDSETRRLEKKVLLLFAGSFIIITFISMQMRIRYILPAIPPLILLAAFGLKGLISMAAGMHSGVRQSALTGVIFLAVSGLLLQNYVYLTDLFKTVRPLTYISGQVERDAYIEDFRPAFTVHRYAAKHLDSDVKILGLMLGYRSYYSDRDLVFGNATFKNAVQRSVDAADVARQLQSDGLTHLLIRDDFFNKWVNDNFTEREKMQVRNFFIEFAPRLFSGRGYGLHAIDSN
jgi:hypothetical protein